jgi:hypothetical protein
LISTRPIRYPSFDGRDTWRPCRVWMLDDGSFTAIVTEIGDGTSVTNQAEAVAAAVRKTYPDAQVIEHYRANEGTDTAEHYSEILHRPGRQAIWRHCPTSELTARLGDLTTNYPIGPVVDGHWPALNEVTL